MGKNPATDSETALDSELTPEQEILAEGADPEIRANYSFKGGQRGRYAHLFPQKPHWIVLSPDMAAVFPDSDAVNEALRTLVKGMEWERGDSVGRE